jgi:hypothetical protein
MNQLHGLGLTTNLSMTGSRVFHSMLFSTRAAVEASIVQVNISHDDDGDHQREGEWVEAELDIRHVVCALAEMSG